VFVVHRRKAIKGDERRGSVVLKYTQNKKLRKKRSKKGIR
jgi:hypothetical protein